MHGAPCTEAPRQRRLGVCPSKLGPFKGEIDRLLGEQVWNAEVIYAEIKALGYRGGKSILRDNIRPKRVLRKSKGTVRFETPPGQQLQADWGGRYAEIGGLRTKVHIAVNTLGYSRRFLVYAALMEGTQRSFHGQVFAGRVWGIVQGDAKSNFDLPSLDADLLDYQAVARRKLRMLNNAHSLDDLRIPPANRLEALKGNRKGQHSIRIND